MKLLSFIHDGRSSYGVVKNDGVIDLGLRFGERDGFATLRQLLAADVLNEVAELLRSEAPDMPLLGLEFAPVIPDPDKIICVGLNYRDHVAEVGRPLTDKPSLFARFPASQVGHLQSLVRPRVSEQFDYEGELAVVIGKGGRHIATADALDHVAGYTCYNEGSIRDWQIATTQFLAGKTFAETGGFGPWLVTTDEINDPSTLILETRLNGRVVQHSTVGELITTVPQLIAYCSTILPLVAGDVIVTGTPAGVGGLRNPPLFMKAGDVVEVEISKIGILKNTVVDEAA